MGAVGVELADEVRALRERAGEAGDVGAPEAELGRAVQHLGAQPLGERAGAVGRGVVDHEQVEVLGGERGPRRGDHARERRGLVVGREDEPDGTGHVGRTLEAVNG